MIGLAGNHDIASEVRSAGIRRISIVDSERTHHLVYVRDCTLVYGE